MRPVFIVKIVDGLGNQMFEYAWARTMQLLYGGDIILDAHSFKKNKLRALSLQHFVLNKNVRIATTVKDKFIVYMMGAYKKIVDKLFSLNNLSTYKIKANLGIYEQISNMMYDSQIKPRLKYNYIEGSWMSEQWFKCVKEVIKQDYVIKNPPKQENIALIKEMQSCNSVCIHVRLGDYLLEPYNSMSRVCGNEYYNEAIRLIKERVDNPVFYLFTNRPVDFDYLKNKYKFNAEIKFMNLGNSDIEDLRLMCSCKHQIMSNSTFSWWAQYLNPNPDKIIIAPCMHNKHSRWNLQCLFLDNWILVGPEYLNLKGFSATETVNSISPKMPWQRVVNAVHQQCV